jgi:hypothetical protein
MGLGWTWEFKFRKSGLDIWSVKTRFCQNRYGSVYTVIDLLGEICKPVLTLDFMEHRIMDSWSPSRNLDPGEIMFSPLLFVFFVLKFKVSIWYRSNLGYRAIFFIFFYLSNIIDLSIWRSFKFRKAAIYRYRSIEIFWWTIDINHLKNIEWPPLFYLERLYVRACIMYVCIFRRYILQGWMHINEQAHALSILTGCTDRKMDNFLHFLSTGSTSVYCISAKFAQFLINEI